MEKKLYTGTVCKINSLDTNYRTVVQEDELNCINVRISKVSSEILEDLWLFQNTGLSGIHFLLGFHIIYHWNWRIQ